ncbi:hypothetical protein PHLCEN_2v11020 [Hermanssonia centrifuga]|uniref:Uncharacterized protein n=1 Tax=Hermanssonia centrifuga TaxID=98765 RepID=A0A2R6NLJ3_9APHY|nr:hypothetical protein PHLCEN_2v11020 [Hermanssonia centrifuga]
MNRTHQPTEYERRPLLQDGRQVTASYASNSTSNSSIAEYASVTTDMPETASQSRPFGGLFASLLVDSIPGWCVALGGTTALDTLGSQAFTGGDRPSDVSIHLQRCIFILWLLYIPIAIFWACVDPILRILGQEERLSHDVQCFLRFLIMGAPGYIAFESLKKYLQCQGQLFN